MTLTSPSDAIDYAPPPNRWRRRRVAALTILAVCGAVASAAYAPPLWRQVIYLQRQRSCLAYRFPENAVIFTDEPSKCDSLRHDPLYAAVAVRGAVAATGSGALARSVPTEAARLGLPTGSAQGCAFLGERTVASGNSYLVALRYVVGGDVNGRREVVFEADVFRPAGYRPGSRLTSVTSGGTVDGADSGTVTILTAEPDPTTPSRFTLTYDLGGRRKSLAGELVDLRPSSDGMSCGNAVGLHVVFYRE